MADKLDREGIFRARPLEFGLKKFDNSSSVAIAIRFKILDQLNQANEWESWQSYDVEVDGDFYIVKKDGSMHEDQIKRLINSLNWDGDFDTIFADEFLPTDCQITVKSESYDGKEYYKATWISPYDYTPKQKFQVSSNDLSELKSQFGAKLRAIASNVKSNSKPIPQTARQSPTTKPMEEDKLPY
jgi:hypothetical protein